MPRKRNVKSYGDLSVKERRRVKEAIQSQPPDSSSSSSDESSPEAPTSPVFEGQPAELAEQGERHVLGQEENREPILVNQPVIGQGENQEAIQVNRPVIGQEGNREPIQVDEQGAPENVEAELLEESDDESALSDENRDQVDEDENETEDEIQDDINNEPADDNPLLYPDASMSLHEAMVAIFLFVSKFKLSGVCFAQLLALLSILLPAQNLLKKTVYSFKKYFADLKGQLVLHYYCGGCYKTLAGPTEDCTTCPGGTEREYFIEVPVISHLQKLFLREGFLYKLSYPSRRTKRNEHCIEDIYDGEIYKVFESKFKLKDVASFWLSFMWNTDGISVFKSSKFSIWPLYLVINELSPQTRHLKENMILCGLWFGTGKPSANAFLTAFRPTFNQLKSGVDFQFPNTDRPKRVRAMIICGTCDTPAKSLFFNQVAHNGFHGCPKCTQKGEKSPRSENVFVYPKYQEKEKRTDASTWQHACSASRSGTTVMGMKGTAVIFLIALNAVLSTSIDSMHACYSGVMKKLLKLWFDPKYSGETFSLRRLGHAIDKRLLSLKPPNFVQRLPCSIMECLSFWKASEFRSFLFYYGLPVLYGIMDQGYFNHFMLLVNALFLLNSDSISQNDIQQAKILIEKFVCDFEDLYGVKFMTINFHLLLHLPDCVKELGPLWSTSCFGFESLNGQLTATVHGTRHLPLQICSSVSYFTSIPQLMYRLNDGPLLQFCKKMTSKSMAVKLRERIGENVHLVGKLKKLVNLPPIVQRAIAGSRMFAANVYSFLRLKKGSFLYISESYTRSEKMCSSVLVFEDGATTCLGVIKTFVKLANCDCNRHCQCAEVTYHAVIQHLTRNSQFHSNSPVSNVRYMWKCGISEDYSLIGVMNLKSLCWKLQVGNELYVAQPVNGIELE